jgi:hypothetical protein
MLQTYSSTSWQPVTTWTAADPLAKAVYDDIRGANPTFLYCSHTFTHQVRGAGSGSGGEGSREWEWE